MEQMTIIPKDEARRQLGWDPNKKYILFGGAFSNTRKNYAILRDAVAQLSPFYSTSNPQLVPQVTINSSNNPLREQVSTPETPSQLVPQLTNSTSNNALREQVKSEPWWISGGVEECIAKAEEIADPSFDSAAYAKLHKAWMSTKIDCTAFLTWFIENYPQSVAETKNANEEFWKRFK